MKRLAAVLLISVFVAGALLVLVSQNPLAAFRTPDGKLGIPGGKLTADLQRLLFPPAPPKTYTTYAPDRSSYPTLNILGTVHDTPLTSSARIDPAGPARPIARLADAIWREAREMMSDALGFFTGRAYAADGICGVGAADNCYWVGGTGAFSTTTHWASTSGGIGDATLPLSTSPVIFDTNSGGGTATNDIASFASGTVTIGGTTTVAGSSNTWTVNGNWNSSTGTFTYGTSTVTLVVTGTLAVNDDGNTFGKRDFYNLSLGASVVTTFTPSPGISNVLTLGANAELAVAGGDPQGSFRVFGDTSTTPVVLGAGADLSHSGYFAYQFGQTTGHVTAALYQHLDIAGPLGGTADLLGDISTPLCGVFNECAIIMLAYQPNTTFTVNTNNHNVRAGGTLWLGDGGGFGVTFNAGSSTITGYSITPTGNNTVAHFQTATLIGRPSSTDENLCYESTYTVQVFFESSTFNCYGQLRVSSGFIDAGSATINVIHDGACMPSADCGTDNVGSHSPGEVVVFSGTYIIFGTSTWRVDSLWQNGNIVAEPNWSTGTATVTFHQTGINTDYRFGGSVLGQAEFHNIVFDYDVAQSTAMTTNGLWIDGSVVFRNTHGTTTTMTAGSLTLTFNSLSVAATGAVLIKDGFSVTNVSMSANTGTILLSAWTKLDVVTPDVEWTFNPNTSSTTVTVTKGGLPVSTNVSLYRDGTSVDDEKSDSSGNALFTATSGWSSHAMKIASGPGPAAGSGGTPPPTMTPTDGSQAFSISYPTATAIDWITGRDTCSVVQITDTRTAGVGSYVIDWGDGTALQTIQAIPGQHMTARHTYAQPSMYTIMINTFDGQNKQTGSFFVVADATGTTCSLKLFAKYLGFTALIAASVVGLLAVLLAASRQRRNSILGRRLALASIVLFIVALASYAYAGVFWFPGLTR